MIKINYLIRRGSPEYKGKTNNPAKMQRKVNKVQKKVPCFNVIKQSNPCPQQLKTKHNKHSIGKK